MPGVVGILTGAELAEDKIGDLICGWMIHSKDGSPMKMGSHPALAKSKVRYVGDHVAVVIAETLDQAKDAASAIEVDYEVLPAVADLATAQDARTGLVHDEIPGNTAFARHLGDKAATDAAFARAHHVTKLDIVNQRLVPNPMEPRAAIGDYDSGNDAFTLWTTSQNPHVARLVLSAFVGIAPEHKLRVIAPDVGGGFGSKIFIYAEETVCAWASKRVGRPVKWTSDRSEAFPSDAHGRDHITHAELALDEKGKILGLKVATRANMGAYLSTFASSIPTYLYATLLSGQYDIPAIYCEVDAVYTTTTPVDAYRGAGRPEATFVVERLAEVAARELHLDPADFRKRNFVKKFPHTTPVIMTYDAGNYRASLDKAMEIADVKGFGKRRRESARRGKLRGLGYSCYIEACGIAPSQAVGSLGAGVGLWKAPRCASTRPAMSKCSPARTATARGMRPPSPSWSPRASASPSRTSSSSMATPTRCSSAWAPTVRAPARSACRPSSRRSTRSRPRRRRSPRTSWKLRKATSSSPTASSPWPAPTAPSTSPRSRSTPMWRTNSRPRRSSRD